MRGFTFDTKKNKYYYDDITGNVSVANDKFTEKFFYENKENQLYKFTETDIFNAIKLNGLKSLILVVTESCNLRCKYCVYSGTYRNYRTHTNNYMQFETAKKAIDHYINSIYSLNYSFPLLQPVIAFYGGEPLVNYELVKKVFEYIDNNYKYPVLYTLTTNATMLTEEILENLVKHKVLLLISINGDKQENDRLRVYKNGEGTFDKIYYWIEFISKNYPEYYQQYVLFSAVYDANTDFQRIEKFFENDLLKNKLFNIAPVMTEGTNWYNQFSKDELIAFNNRLQRLLKRNLTKLKQQAGSRTPSITNFVRRLLMGDFINKLGRTRNCTAPLVGNSCIPGQKIAVSTNGSLYMCERCSMSRSIGNVDTWLDYKAITNLTNEFNENIRKDCISCPISRLCPICIKSGLTSDGVYDKSLINCNNYINSCTQIMSQIFDCYENGLDLNPFILETPLAQKAKTIELV